MSVVADSRICVYMCASAFPWLQCKLEVWRRTGENLSHLLRQASTLLFENVINRTHFTSALWLNTNMQQIVWCLYPCVCVVWQNKLTLSYMTAASYQFSFYTKLTLFVLWQTLHGTFHWRYILFVFNFGSFTRGKCVVMTNYQISTKKHVTSDNSLDLIHSVRWALVKVDHVTISLAYLRHPDK